MAKILTESAIFSTDIEVPEAGDPRRAYSLELAFQKLLNRTAYLKNVQDNTWATGAVDPEGSEIALPGTHYLATGEAGGAGELHVKLTGSFGTGWTRLVRYEEPDAVRIYDYSSGSDATKHGRIRKITSGTSNRLAIQVEQDATSVPSSITLYSDDDGAVASQIWLQPANNNGVLYAFSESALRPVKGPFGSYPALGTLGDPWAAGYFSGSVVCDSLSSASAVLSGNVQAASAELGLLTMTGAINSDTGSSIPGKHYTMPDSNTNVNWSTANVIYIPSVSTTRTLTLQTAGVPDGAIYRVYVRRGVVTSTGVNITHRDGVAAMRNSSGGFVWADFEVQDGFLQLMGGEYVA